MSAVEANREECDRPALVQRVRAICATDAPWPEILQRTLALTGEELKVSICSYWHLTPDRTAMVCQSAWRSSSEGSSLDEFIVFTKNLAFPKGFGLPGRAWLNNDVTVSEQVDHDRNFVRATVARDAKLESAVAIPVRVGGEIVGVIECLSRGSSLAHEHTVLCLKDIAEILGESAPTAAD